MVNQVVVVDGGNLLFRKTLPKSGPGVVNAKIAAEGIAKSYGLMKYDGIGVSSVDLSAGINFFQNSLQSDIPWLSTNVLGPNGAPFFPPSTIVKRAGLKIGIIGVTNPDKNPHHIGFTITSWQEPLRKSIKQIKNDCDVLILLASFSQLECKEIANHFPEINIIVSADKKRGKTEPVVVKNSLITQSTSRGKYIGQLSIYWENSNDWLSKNNPKKKLNHKLHFIEKKIKRLQGQTKKNTVGLENELTRLQNTKEDLLRQIKELEEKYQLTLERNPNRYSSTFLSVRPRHSPKEIEDIVNTIQETINSYNKLVAKSKIPFDKTLRNLLRTEELAGPSSCMNCHEKQTTFWKTTSHAHSYQTLLKKGQAYNPACLVCHVNGGSITPASSINDKIFLLSVSADQNSVSCEMCHGPGLAHAKDPETVAPVRTPEERGCLVCHTHEQDDDFQYEQKLSLIACPVPE